MPNITDIFAETRDLCDANSTSYPDTSLLRRTNANLETVIGWIINADGTWQFDDSNYTDLPVGCVALSEGQSKVTFNDKFLQISEISIKDKLGNFYILEPIDQAELDGSVPLEVIFKDSGRPLYYDKISDDTIKLFPSVSINEVTLSEIVDGKETGGLKVKFKRTANLFVNGDIATGTKVPGFVSTFHYILSYMNAIPYCMKYKKDRVSLYEKRAMEMKDGLIEAYSQREKDKRKKITMAGRPFM